MANTSGQNIAGYLTATRRVVDVRMAGISNLFIMDFDIGSSRKTRRTHHGISSLLIETGLTKHPKVLKEKQQRLFLLIPNMKFDTVIIRGKP